MKHDGHTVLLTTHYLEEAEALCDRIAIIDRGRIVATGSPRELTSGANAAPAVRLFASSPLPPEIFAGVAGIAGLEIDGAAARFTSTRANAALAEVLNRLATRGIDVVELHVQRASLENVFLQLTGSNGEQRAASGE
jgi:ABC-2 type transport system ATP-binding protein